MRKRERTCAHASARDSARRRSHTGPEEHSHLMILNNNEGKPSPQRHAQPAMPEKPRRFPIITKKRHEMTWHQRDQNRLTNLGNCHAQVLFPFVMIPARSCHSHDEGSFRSPSIEVNLAWLFQLVMHSQGQERSRGQRVTTRYRRGHCARCLLSRGEAWAVNHSPLVFLWQRLPSRCHCTLLLRRVVGLAPSALSSPSSSLKLTSLSIVIISFIHRTPFSKYYRHYI